MSFNEAEAESVRRWNDRLKNPIPLLLRVTKDERSADFETYAAEFTRLAPNLRIVKEGLEAKAPPAIHAGELFCFHALPKGRELSAFLDILSKFGSNAHQKSDHPSLIKLEAVRWPADLIIYVTPQCVFCPKVVEHLSLLPFINSLVRMTIIDGLYFPEMAEKDGIRSVPTVILDGQLRWTGQPDLEEIIDALIHRDSARLSVKAVQDFVKEGNAVLLAEMMLREERIFPAIVDLLVHPEWSVRLGAMVVVEEIADRNADLAAKILKPLWERLKYAEEYVKGDSVYLFGHLGSDEWLPELEKLLQEESGTELREVLEESIQRLRNRGRKELEQY